MKTKKNCNWNNYIPDVMLIIGIIFLLSISSIALTQNTPVFNNSGIIMSKEVQSTDKYVDLNYSGVGITDSAYINTNLQIQHQGSFSWFCWIASVSTYPYGYILSDYSSDARNNVRLQMRGTTGQLKLMFKLGGATLNIVTPPGLIINDGKDHFIGFVMDRENGVCILWVDGNQEAGIQLDGNDMDLLDNPTPFWIGTKNQYQLYTFKGIIDNVLIYNRALLDSEIYYLYGGQTMKTCGNPNEIRMDELLGWFQFSERFGGRPENSITGELGLFTGHMIYWIDHRDREHIYY